MGEGEGESESGGWSEKQQSVEVGRSQMLCAKG